MFLPVTNEEMKTLGWSQLDVILVTGDAYIDSPLIGVAVIGKVLANAGYRVGILPQPNPDSDDITRLGEPSLFWGVTAGSVDSLVANTTALKKRRRDDDYTPGGKNNRRPDRASIVYSNLIRRHFKGTVPIVLGGIEASLRRIAHYDYWSDSIRRSLLFDAKADILVYGMAEKTILELAEHVRNEKPLDSLRGICRIVKEPPGDAIQLPAYETVRNDKKAFTSMFFTFYENSDPVTAHPLVQKHGDRWLLQHPSQFPLSREELDSIYSLKYERNAHPSCAAEGEVRALDTIRFSLTTHRGCYGECNFCAIATHQGRQVQSRSEESIINEARELTKHPSFKGVLYDGGSPTGNMYATSCPRWKRKGACSDKRCLTPHVCEALQNNHSAQIRLLKKLRELPGVKHVFVTSGLRYDMILSDKVSGDQYLDTLTEHHVSGQMKIAPEHTENHVLDLMGKPGKEILEAFRKKFSIAAKKAERKTGKKSFLTYYLIAAHPGCSDHDMEQVKRYTQDYLKLTPEQVQVFTPLPSTWSSVMYWTGLNPFTGVKIFVEQNPERKKRQKEIITGRIQANRSRKQLRKGSKSQSRRMKKQHPK